MFNDSPQMASLWTYVMKLGNIHYVPLVCFFKLLENVKVSETQMLNLLDECLYLGFQTYAE